VATRRRADEPTIDASEEGRKGERRREREGEMGEGKLRCFVREV
jgi:hypothetical protein